MTLNRGNKMWQGSRFVLPEHRESILIRERQKQARPRPVLEEDTLSEMSRVLAEAIQTDLLVTITVYDPYGNKRLRMYPKRIDPIARKLKGLTADGDHTITVALPDILNVEPN